MRRPEGDLSRSQWLGLLILCLLSASAWLVDGAFPSTLPSVERQAFHDFAIAAVLSGLGWRKISIGTLRPRPWAQLSLASILLLGVPATLAQAALSSLSEGTIAGLFALVPVIVVVLVSSFGSGGEATSGVRGLLGPALIGLAGVLLLLSFVTPNTLRQAGFEGMVTLGVALAAFACVWLYRLLSDFTVVEAAVVLSLANALFFLAVFVVSSWIGSADGLSHLSEDWSSRGAAIEVATAIVFELPQVVLLVWLLREIAPARFAARYLVIPLITVIEGYIALRPEITLQASGSALLIVFGAWRMLTAKRNDVEPGLMLR